MSKLYAFGGRLELVKFLSNNFSLLKSPLPKAFINKFSGAVTMVSKIVVSFECSTKTAVLDLGEKNGRRMSLKLQRASNGSIV